MTTEINEAVREATETLRPTGTARKRSIAAFFSLLQYDLSTLWSSWVVRFWFLLTIIGAVSAVLLARNYSDQTSFFISWALVLYSGLGSFVALIVSASAVSAERSFLGVAIISRGIAPTPYLLAKLCSRAITILGMFLFVMVPTMFIVQTQGLTNDMTTSGMLLALAYWSLMLTVLVFLGITVSVMFTNTLLGVTVLGVFWYLGLMLLAAAYAGDLTVDGVLGGLPLVLQGQSRMVEISTILIIGGIPLLVLPFIATRIVNSRDM
jgi:hypothetical protein